MFINRTKGFKEWLTDRIETGIPSLVIGPTPSDFFGGGAWVDVIFLVSSNLLSLVSLLNSRLMVWTEKRIKRDYLAISNLVRTFLSLEALPTPSPISLDLTGLRGFVLNEIDFSFCDDEFWRLRSTLSLICSAAVMIDEAIKTDEEL